MGEFTVVEEGSTMVVKSTSPTPYMVAELRNWLYAHDFFPIWNSGTKSWIRRDPDLGRDRTARQMGRGANVQIHIEVSK